MLDLLIVNPAGAHGIYGDLGDRLIAVEPPLWARLIAGYVRDAGFKVAILDAEAQHLGPNDVAAKVNLLRPMLTCLTVYGHQPSASTQQMVAAEETARAIKQRGPFNTIAVGGHISALPERTLLENSSLNYIATGEGVRTIVDLLRYARGVGPMLTHADGSQEKVHDGPNLKDIAGLGWRPIPHMLDKVQINPLAPLIEDLGQLHGNAWDLLPMHLYRAHNWQAFGNMAARQPYASIYTSLGCPYKCSFCCINAPFASNRYRMRDPADVVTEIAMLYDRYGIRTFKITDEMFVLNEAHYTAIADGLVIHGLGSQINIWAYARVDTVKPDKLALLRRAGVRWLALGIESGSAHVRDGASKKFKNDDIIGVVRAIQAAGINVIGNYIFGLPDDDFVSMGETFNLACLANTEFANFYSAMAYPGSKLYDEAVASGWTLPATWRGYSQHNDDCRPLDTKHITGVEVLKYRDDAFRAYFSRPKYLNMVGDKFGVETVAHIREMLGYTLHRKILTELVSA